MKIIGFALCLEDGDEGSFVPNKIYPILEPFTNDPKEYLRIVDESGEDYLYPEIYFEIVRLNQPAQNKLISYFQTSITENAL
ncbi:MAG TPA: hypothetical protein VK892_16605 [Pyrinomonadaceae bacterium]|nr:hypothetical protein [Pyrinomonadaceae bacterium]